MPDCNSRVTNVTLSSLLNFYDTLPCDIKDKLLAKEVSLIYRDCRWRIVDYPTNRHFMTIDTSVIENDVASSATTFEKQLRYTTYELAHRRLTEIHAIESDDEKVFQIRTALRDGASFKRMLDSFRIQHPDELDLFFKGALGAYSLGALIVLLPEYDIERHLRVIRQVCWYNDRGFVRRLKQALIFSEHSNATKSAIERFALSLDKRRERQSDGLGI